MNDTPSKVVLISGGMGGVGRATTSLFLENGYRVAVLYWNTHTADTVQAKITFGKNIHLIRCDIRKDSEVKRAVSEVVEKFGTIDICIHAAVGKIIRAQLCDMSASDFRDHFEVGLFGACNLFSAVAAVMKKNNSGIFIGITSSGIEPRVVTSRMGAYITVKFALRGLLRELHSELHKEGIDVYAIAPDLMQTALTADLPERYFEFAKERTPKKQLMTPHDVAQAVFQVATGSVPAGTSLLVSTGEFSPL